jgi:nucleotide-binding universal stress UspA family protein/predicted phosphoribosyltransferase
MQPIRRILVAVDFHAASLRALAYAARLAHSGGAQLTVLHVHDLAAQAYPDELVPPVPLAELQQAAKRDLDDLVVTLQQRGIDAKGSIRQGVPADEIIDAAGEVEADLLVLGTHGRRGLSRLVLGSVAEQVVRRSSVPVVTLHEWHFENRAEAAHRLAPKVAPLRGEFDVTIAITRGAVPIAIDLARRLDTPVDVLLVEPILGPGGAPIGATCEDGSLVIDQATADEKYVDSDAVAHATDAARSIARERARWLAEPSGPRSVAEKRVLLVSDVLVAPSVALVAARAVSRRGAKCVSLTVPICASRILVALPPAIDSTLCVESTQLESPRARVYHDEAEPSNVEAAEMLLRAGHRAAQSQPTAT